jgi:hypothetical protein
MLSITDKDIRAYLRKRFKEFNKLYKPFLGRKLNLNNLDTLFVEARKIAKISRITIIKHAESQISLANAAIACLGLLSLSVYSEKNEEELFPRDWLSDNSRPNANSVLSCMLCQLTNYSLSMVILLERGLDASARALFRIVLELSWIILSVLMFRDEFKEYIKQKDENDAKGIWYRLFTLEKLNRKLAHIEKTMGLDDQVVLDLREARKSSYAFYSQVAHHSYTSVILGSRGFSYDGENSAIGLFGGPNEACVSTLHHLNYGLWYFRMLFCNLR